MRFKVSTLIGSDSRRQLNQEIHSLNKSSTTHLIVSAGMSYTGTTSGQCLKRSMIVIQYWQHSDYGNNNFGVSGFEPVVTDNAAIGIGFTSKTLSAISAAFGSVSREIEARIDYPNVGNCCRNNSNRNSSATL
ncbi:hypothetical protein CEXT_564151 [Caerostris extrusa]|uniref:Uncharacterized protein n=1 Tax=Caerostris extrusa TaxID=172846 RepID=A0AAV4XMZ0_CAEEX|nr:hypothetical protein CEXT_564151 [Caerostris extrusa]